MASSRTPGALNDLGPLSEPLHPSFPKVFPKQGIIFKSTLYHLGANFESHVEILLFVPDPDELVHLEVHQDILDVEDLVSHLQQGLHGLDLLDDLLFGDLEVFIVLEQFVDGYQGQGLLERETLHDVRDLLGLVEFPENNTGTLEDNLTGFRGLVGFQGFGDNISHLLQHEADIPSLEVMNLGGNIFQSQVLELYLKTQIPLNLLHPFHDDVLDLLDSIRGEDNILVGRERQAVPLTQIPHHLHRVRSGYKAHPLYWL